jgi:lysozyme
MLPDIAKVSRNNVLSTTQKMTQVTSLVEMLDREEGTVLVVYDDATGTPLRPGYTLVGHPTIGTGRALDTHGITKDEAQLMLGNDLDEIASDLATLSWYQSLDENRQDCITAMAFQLGVAGVLMFHSMIAAIVAKDYKTAAADMLQSKWATETPARAKRMSQMMATGQWPSYAE